jgi:hypothetical protein
VNQRRIPESANGNCPAGFPPPSDYTLRPPASGLQPLVSSLPAAITRGVLIVLPEPQRLGACKPSRDREGALFAQGPRAHRGWNGQMTNEHNVQTNPTPQAHSAPSCAPNPDDRAANSRQTTKKDTKRTHRSGLALSRTPFPGKKRTQTNPTSRALRPGLRAGRNPQHRQRPNGKETWTPPEPGATPSRSVGVDGSSMLTFRESIAPTCRSGSARRI